VNAQHADVQEDDATNAYQSLAETTGLDDPRWAFGGSGPDGAVAETDSPLPDGAEPADLAEYCLMLGDDALIYSHRLTEWVTNAPELEEEVALANIGLDLLGQARVLLARAGHADAAVGGTANGAQTSASPDAEDRLAFWRSEAEFRCVRLVEIAENLDFGRCIARLLVFATWRLALLGRLLGSADPVIAAIAAKGVRELAYHRDYAARWTLRLGDGTEESHRRMQQAVDWVWPYTEELFACSETEHRLVGPHVSVDPSEIREEFDSVLREVLETATLTLPERPPVGRLAGRAGRQGVHTEMLGPLLTEMQSLAREHPEATW
jgi:ring-1,2-phenylacetyl-CoA epoxidase subunit PaaC